MAKSAEFIGIAALAALSVAVASRPRSLTHRRGFRAADRRRAAARRIDWGAALLALAALSDSGIEHYRGSFHNQAMYAPLAVSALTLAASLHDAIAPHRKSPVTDPIDNLAIGTGVIGTGFHLYNIGKRPGGFSWLNLFYAAPLGAPASLSLAGMLRWMAATVRRDRAEVCGIPTPSALAALVSLGMVGTSAEATLLHFRGAYHNPAMAIPVTFPPVAALLLARAALRPGRRHRVTRWSLRLLAAVGLAGSAFHAYGIQRNMGGWRNWSQNVLNGPPLPAPPAFTALAIAGLATLDLIEREPR